MDVRGKLVELLNEMQDSGIVETPAGFGSTKKYIKNELIASHLIAHGVTVQEWISVKDRLPEQGQEIIVYSGGVLKPTVFAYQFWNKHYDSWARITHWMPLPQPPKGE